MIRFDEQDVRRFYDLLQHKPELGLTQLSAMDGNNLIGVGLFDNEDDFVSECERYNELGQLYAGVNPRSSALLDQYGGLENRIRSLFVDVVTDTDVACVTGVALSNEKLLTPAAQAYVSDVSILDDGTLFFPMDESIEIGEDEHTQVAELLAAWFYGVETTLGVDLALKVSVPGTAKPDAGWFRPRFRFRKYRPYILEGISEAIQDSEEE